MSQHYIINSQGVVGTRYLYFFSDNHSIANVTRAFQGKGQSIPQPNPFKQPSVHFRDKDLPAHMNWLPPPFKSFFQVPRVRDVLGSRPLVIIQNKYVSQFGQPPSNFLSVDLLRKILRYLTTKYEVLYKRFVPKELEEKGQEINWLETPKPAKLADGTIADIVIGEFVADIELVTGAGTVVMPRTQLIVAEVDKMVLSAVLMKEETPKYKNANMYVEM